MVAIFHTLLPVTLTFAILATPLLIQPISGKESSSSSTWGLELRPLRATPHRAKRYAFPGSDTPCLTVSFLTELKGRFHERIDPNDDGKATEPEVRQYLRNFNPAVTDEQVRNFITRRDLNENGIIEFVPEYIRDIITPDMTSEAASEWFELEDGDGDGFVTRQELVSIARRLGMSEGEAEENVSSYYMPVDQNEDGQLSLEEYKELYE